MNHDRYDDAYIAGILYRAMMHVFDPSYVMNDLLRLIGAALAAYGAAFLVLRRLARAHLHAGALAVALLVDRRVLRARVRVEKLDVYPESSGVGVELERRQPRGG